MAKGGKEGRELEGRMSTAFTAGTRKIAEQIL